MNARYDGFTNFVRGRMAMFTSYKIPDTRIKAYWDFLAYYPNDIIKQSIDKLLDDPERKRFPTGAQIKRECISKMAFTAEPEKSIYCAYCSRIAPSKGQKCTCGVIIEGLSDVVVHPFDSNTEMSKRILNAALERQNLNLSWREYNIKTMKENSHLYKGAWGRIAKKMEEKYLKQLGKEREKEDNSGR